MNLEATHTARSACTQVSDGLTNFEHKFIICECTNSLDDSLQFESLSNNEHLENQKLRVLEDELNDLFEITRDLKKQNYECHRKRLSDIFQKSEQEKNEAYRKLDFIRRQLIDLEVTVSDSCNKQCDCDSGFSSKSENDQDVKILDGVRKRMKKLNDTNFELKKKVQQMEIEKNELQSKLQGEKVFVQRNSETLKQVADLLCNMSGKQFSYNDIYNQQCNQNPFCEAILELEKSRLQREEQLLKKMDNMEETIFSYEKELQVAEQHLANPPINEGLKCQMEQMQNEMYEKECRIKQLNSMLTRLSHIRMEAQQPEPQHQKEAEFAKITAQLEQAMRRNETMSQELERVQKNERFLQSETRKLNEEICDFQRKNGDLTTQIHRLAALLKTQEAHRMELSQKYEFLESNYEEQSKQLRTAHLQMTHLQDRFSMMEKRTSEHNMERDLLREEVLCLKEKEATMLGKQKAFQDQLYKIQKELFTAHDVIKEQQAILQRNDCAHGEAIKRLQETGNDTKRQFNVLVEDYNKLHEEYEKLNEIRRQNEKVIESFRKWKDAQLKSDEATRNSFKQYEEHIKLLLEEKQRFLEKYRQMHCDYNILQAELDRLRCSAFNLNNTTGANTSDNSISNRMELIRRTSRRVSEHSSSLKDNSSGDPLKVRRHQQE